MSEAKPFCISKWEVWEAYKRVKANQGAAGVDEQSIRDFERNLKGNLYRSGIGCRRAATFHRRCGR
jgi:RNA-directed DNA polymerase